MSKEVAACGGGCLICLLLALIFTCLKGRAAMLVSGFNTLPKEARKQYDTERMSRDHRNLFLIWAGVFGAGAVLAYYISRYMAAAAFVVWLLLFFKEVHLDEEKAFGKYKR